MKLEDKILNFFVVILIITSLVLGYGIYKQRSSMPSGESKQFASVQSATSDYTQPREEQYFSIDPLLDGLGLSEEEKQALSYPGMDAPDREKQRHFELVKSIAQRAQRLDITKCDVADPVVLEVRQGETFTVINNDTQAHTIGLDENFRFEIVPGGKKEIVVADFNRLDIPAVYGYGCDSVAHPVGMIYITE